MTEEIRNTFDIIDSRDVIARIEELQSMLPETAEDVMPGTSGEIEDIQAELDALEKLAKQGEDYAADWGYGETLIRDSFFEEYARELAEDCGMIDRDAKWPARCIDWERAAEELKSDYTAIHFDGETYWIR